MQRTGGINPVPDRMDLRGGEGRSISWRWTPGCFRGPSRPNLPCAWVTLPGTSRHGPYAVDCRVRNKARDLALLTRRRIVTSGFTACMGPGTT
jgi:hypothetical protein